MSQYESGPPVHSKDNLNSRTKINVNLITIKRYAKRLRITDTQRPGGAQTRGHSES